MNENDPTQYNDPNLETEFFRLGELQRNFEEKYARGVGGVAITGVELGE